MLALERLNSNSEIRFKTTPSKTPSGILVVSQQQASHPQSQVEQALLLQKQHSHLSESEIEQVNKIKLRKSAGLQPKEEIDKHFQDFLKFRKHDDYIEYKMNYIDAKKIIKNLSKVKASPPQLSTTTTTSNFADRKISLILDSNIKTTPTRSTYKLNNELPALSNNKKPQKLYVQLTPTKAGTQKSMRPTNGVSGAQAGGTLFKSLDFSDASFVNYRENTVDSIQQIKLIDKTKRKSIVNQLRRLSKIKAIKEHTYYPIPDVLNVSFMDLNNTGFEANTESTIEMIPPLPLPPTTAPAGTTMDDGIVILNREDAAILPKLLADTTRTLSNLIIVKEFDDNEVNNQDQPAPEQPIAATAAAIAQLLPAVSIEAENQEANCDDEDKSSFQLASNIPVFEIDEKHSLDDNRDEDFHHDERKYAKRMNDSIMRTKEWIEAHDYFFSLVPVEF